MNMNKYVNGLHYICCFYCVLGLALLAASFPDDQSRSLATSKAFAGISFGVAGKGYYLE